MSNLKISQLTGTTVSTINDYLVKNNSGETTTNKVQLKDVLGMTSPNGNDAVQTASFLTSLGTTANTQSAIAIGNGAEATSPYSIAIGHQALNQNRDGGRDYYICIGFDAQAVQGATGLGRSVRAIGADSTAIGISAIAAGNGSFALGNSAFADNSNSVSLGNSASNFGQNQVSIGYLSNNSGGNNGVSIGFQAKIFAEGATCIGNQSNARGIYSVILGYNNNVESGQTNSIAVGVQNVISGGTGGIAVGSLNTVSHSNSVVMGYGLSSLYQDTTHADNHHTYRMTTHSVINAGSVGGSINVDLSAGTLFEFELTGNTTPNFINWREGQEIKFVIFNNGTHTVPTLTISGGGSVYAKGGSVNPTNNGRSLYYGTILGGDLYLDEELNFSAV